MERQERILQRDSVASAYIAVGRLDRLTHEEGPHTTAVAPTTTTVLQPSSSATERENRTTLHRKHKFMSQLSLALVTPQYKESKSYSYFPSRYAETVDQ